MCIIGITETQQGNMIMLDLSGLTPMQAGRVNAALDKRYNYATAGVLSLRQFIELHANTATKAIGNHSHEYTRSRFNRMNREQQAAYDARLSRPCYNFCYSDGYSISIPKIVFDVLTIPNA